MVNYPGRNESIYWQVIGLWSNYCHIYYQRLRNCMRIACSSQMSTWRTIVTSLDRDGSFLFFGLDTSPTFAHSSC
jgi:hypothetical protein